MKKGKKGFLLLIAFSILFSVVALSSQKAISQAILFEDVHNKLMQITEEEIRVLKNLFLIVQEIEEIEREERQISEELNLIYLTVADIEANITKEEENFEKNKEVLKKILRSYQQRGPGNFLEIILTSESLTTFLRRINILRDLTRNTEELLMQMEEIKEKLLRERQILVDKQEQMEGKQQQLREALTKGTYLRSRLEATLEALAEEREVYQSYLEKVLLMRQELKPLISEISLKFSRMIQEGSFPEDALNINVSLLRIRGTLEEDTFNHIIEQHPSLPPMEFRFYPDKIKMSLPNHNLVLYGSFVIEEGNRIVFMPFDGSFYGLPLEKHAIEDLFSEGYITIHLEAFLGRNILRSIEIKDRYLEMIIVPAFF